MKFFSSYKTVVYDISIYALAIIKLKETSTRRYPVHFSLPLDIHSTSCIPFSNIFLKLSKKDYNKNIKSFAINTILFSIKMISFFIPVFSNTDFYAFHDITSCTCTYPHFYRRIELQQMKNFSFLQETQFE